MKKTIILISLSIVLVLTLTGCGLLKKTKSDVANFETVVSNAGLQKATIDESTLPSSIEDYAVYCDTNMTYQVEFYDLSSTTGAENLHNDLIEYVENDTSKNFTSKTNASSLNYAINTYGSGDSYYYICHVDDTVFFAFTESAGSDEIKAICEALGY